MRGLRTQGNLPSADPRPGGSGGEDWLANPALPEDIMREAVSIIYFSFISLKSGVGSQLWLIGLGMLLPGLEAHVYVAGNQP